MIELAVADDGDEGTTTAISNAERAAESFRDA